jgi:ribosomal protein S1
LKFNGIDYCIGELI